MAHYGGGPSPTRLHNLALEFCEKSLLRASDVGCGRLVPHYNAPTSYDRHAAIAYLRAESLQLSADYDLLLREFKALFEGPFEPDAHQTWRQKLRQFRGLLANHRLAWQWTIYPPCGVGAPRRCSYAALATPTDFPVITGSAF